MKTTRFDFEQQIMDCWHVTDDLNMVYEYVCDNKPDQDKLANMLLGMKELYHLKFEKLFEQFEQLLKQGKL